MFSACLISLPPEALSRMMDNATRESSSGNAAERRGALWVVALAMIIGTVCGMLG